MHPEAKKQVVRYTIAMVGMLAAALVHTREIFAEAIARKATCNIIAHNHPSRDPTPSREDRAVTDRPEKPGELIGIHLLDRRVLTKDWFQTIMHKKTVQH